MVIKGIEYIDLTVEEISSSIRIIQDNTTKRNASQILSLDSDYQYYDDNK